MPSQQPRGILSPDRQTLSPAQRQEFIRLRAQGVDEPIARALAQALAKSKVKSWLSSKDLAKAALTKGNKPLGAAFSHAKRAKKDGAKGSVKDIAERYVKQKGHKGFGKAAAQEEDKPQHADPKTKGAAFQYARRLNAQRGGNKKNIRQIAEDYLTRRGHAPLTAKKSAKPVVMEDTGLKVAQLAAAGATADLDKAAKSHFQGKFVEAARENLPGYFYDKVHQAARSKAGGKASGDARRARSGKPEHLKQLKDLHKELQEEADQMLLAIAQHPANAEMGKAITPQGQTHVDVPLGSGKKVGSKKGKKRPGKAGTTEGSLPVAKALAEDSQLAQAALVSPDAPQDQRLVNAARLVAGMDWETFVGASDAEDARARASRQLAQDLSYYDSKMQTDDALRRLHGMDVDLGSGQVRQPGYLGLDLYPYDYGTAVTDLGLGIPLGDMSCRAIRLVNALQYMPDYAEDATPLLVDIQRVLTHGGKLFYQGRGDLQSLADWSKLPGLVLVDHKDTSPLPGQEQSTSDLHIQTFERVRVRVPRIFGADPTWLGGDEEGPDDIAYAMAAMGGNAPAERTMEALMVKSTAPVDARVVAPLTNTKPYQKIVYSVVYAPNELDFDGEYMEAGDIEKMAHAAYRNQVPIKVEHGGDPIGAHIVESYIAPTDFMMKGVQGPQSVPQGAWVMAIQFTDDQEWQKVLSGEYRGVSVGGRALYEHR